MGGAYMVLYPQKGILQKYEFDVYGCNFKDSDQIYFVCVLMNPLV